MALEPKADTLESVVPAEFAGQRLDRVAAELFPSFSRSRLQKWIDGGQLRVDGETAGRRQPVDPGMYLSLEPETRPEGEWEPQDIPINLVFQDEHILVIDKPAGLVVHPAAGNRDGTLLNALLYHFPGQLEIPRAGIVHRLDKDTSGLMVVARTLEAQNHLVSQLQARSVTREYLALVCGGPAAPGVVDAPIGRSPTNRLKMAVVRDGKAARTRYQPIERFPGFTLLRLNLESGRTHQIRVHMAHRRWPLVGDPAYGGKPRFPPGCSPELRQAIQGFKRQALHAGRLELIHPSTGDSCCWTSELPDDFRALLEVLREESGAD